MIPYLHRLYRWRQQNKAAISLVQLLETTRQILIIPPPPETHIRTYTHGKRDRKKDRQKERDREETINK